MKQSVKIYRNIKGVKFKHLTSNPNLFSELKKEAKEQGLRCRVINGEELLVEIKSLTDIMLPKQVSLDYFNV